MLDLLESVKGNLLEDRGYNVASDWFEARDSFLSNAAQSFFDTPDKANWKVQMWPRVPAARLKKIWTDYARTGVVRDERGMNDISRTIITAIASLDASNAASGHDNFDPRPEVQEAADRDFTDEEWEQFQAGLVDESGGWLVSDYGLPKLAPLAQELGMTDDSARQLLIVDQILNITHQRSDLSAWIVEGGKSTLDFLFDQPVIDLKKPRY